jgi:hypothetical protein
VSWLKDVAYHAIELTGQFRPVGNLPPKVDLTRSLARSC